MRRIICFVLIFCITLLYVPNTLAKAAAIKISQTKLSLTVGTSKTLKVQNTTKEVIWSSSNQKVAKVSKDGKVTAVKAGNATIRATVSKKTYTCKVTVKEGYKFQVNVIDSLHAEFMISGLNLQENKSDTSTDTTSYTYEISFDKYTVTMKHKGKNYKVIDTETGLISLDGFSCYTEYNEDGEQKLYTPTKIYYKNETLIVSLHYSLNYSSMDLCKTTDYKCKISIAEKVVSEITDKTKVIRYTQKKTTLPIVYDLKAKMLDDTTMEIKLKDSSLQDRYLIDRTESPKNRGELSWSINFKCNGEGYSISLYRSSPIIGQNRIVCPDSLYLRFDGAQLDDKYNKLGGGKSYEDPVLSVDGKTLIFKCTVPNGFDINKMEGAAVSVVNQELGLTGEGAIFEASQIVE